VCREECREEQVFLEAKGLFSEYHIYVEAKAKGMGGGGGATRQQKEFNKTKKNLEPNMRNAKK
jgi:hypothetical protein